MVGVSLSRRSCGLFGARVHVCGLYLVGAAEGGEQESVLNSREKKFAGSRQPTGGVGGGGQGAGWVRRPDDGSAAQQGKVPGCDGGGRADDDGRRSSTGATEQRGSGGDDVDDLLLATRHTAPVGESVRRWEKSSDRRAAPYRGEDAATGGEERRAGMWGREPLRSSSSPPLALRFDGTHLQTLERVSGPGWQTEEGQAGRRAEGEGEGARRDAVVVHWWWCERRDGGLFVAARAQAA